MLYSVLALAMPLVAAMPQGPHDGSAPDIAEPRSLVKRWKFAHGDSTWTLTDEEIRLRVCNWKWSKTQIMAQVPGFQNFDAVKSSCSQPNNMNPKLQDSVGNPQFHDSPLRPRPAPRPVTPVESDIKPDNSLEQAQPQPPMDVASRISEPPHEQTSLDPSGEKIAQTPQWAEEGVNMISTRRSKHGAGALRWNTTLANRAERKAGECVFQHSPEPEVYGEVLYQISGQLSSASSVLSGAVEAWYDSEKKHYEAASSGYTTIPDNSSHEKWGHFVQVIWTSSSSIGCAVQACGGQTSESARSLAVCYFDPPYGVNSDRVPIGDDLEAFKKEARPAVA